VNRFPSLGVAVWAWRGAITLSRHSAIWLPLLLVTGIQILLLLVLLGFHHGGLAFIGLPLVRLLGGESATHYPILYYALPAMFFRANLVISAIFGAIAGGVATLLFARAFGFEAQPGAWRHAWRRAPALIVTTTLALALLLGVTLLLSLIPNAPMQRSGALRWGVRAGSMGVLIVVQSLLVYSTAWIVLMGHRIWPAIRDSVRVTLRTLLPTLIAVSVAAIVHFPFSYALGRVDLIAGKHIRPEVIVGVLGLQIACQLLVTFLLVGAVTRLFLWRMEGAQ
jgi:hypothetical protein